MTTLQERFWVRVQKTEGCWLWTGGLASVDRGDGYGHIGYQGKEYGAHRLSYEWANGPIPAGLFVCHSCDVRRCVNPAHLFVGTNADNIRDASQKGLMHPGEANGRAKLTVAQVGDIRREHATGRITASALARRYGVSRTAVRMLLARTTWNAVSGSV